MKILKHEKSGKPMTSIQVDL